MRKTSINTFTLNSQEIKNAIRRLFIDKLGTEHNFSEKDIDLYMIDEKMSNTELLKLTATLTIKLSDKEV
jgi:hypothetical protein